MKKEFIRSAMLIGEENIKKLENSKVAVFGLGGVGSYVVEALARSAVGTLVLVDDDVVSLSNINRQLIATHDTIDKAKVEVCKDRILSINPQANVITYKKFYLPGNEDNIIAGCDYVIDAIDTVSSKIALIIEATNKNIPIISSMGTGNKLDPKRFEISDIYKTSVCPLCRVMRRELKKQGIKKLKVLYSKEEAIKPLPLNVDEEGPHPKRQTPGSVSFVPSVAGLIMAGEVIKDIINID